ncbi:MAG: hypothetical protein ACREQ5_24395 [Candidatus Dormibacteria bacterium]
MHRSAPSSDPINRPYAGIATIAAICRSTLLGEEKNCSPRATANAGDVDISDWPGLALGPARPATCDE